MHRRTLHRLMTLHEVADEVVLPPRREEPFPSCATSKSDRPQAPPPDLPQQRQWLSRTDKLHIGQPRLRRVQERDQCKELLQSLCRRLLRQLPLREQSALVQTLLRATS